MRAVVQRVKEASVVTEEGEKASIREGLLVFIGVGKADTESDGQYIASKIAKLRVFEDQQGKMNLSLQDREGEVLVVSQFTLYGDCRKGNRPSFIDAAEPERAHHLFLKTIDYMTSFGLKVQKGVFRASMDVRLINHGPVTLLIDSQRSF